MTCSQTLTIKLRSISFLRPVIDRSSSNYNYSVTSLQPNTSFTKVRESKSCFRNIDIGTDHAMHKDLAKLLLLACMAAAVLAKPKPRFIAIPLEDVQLVEVEDLPGSSLVRVPRQIKSTDQSADASRHERQAAHDHHEYVDFGAHTGHHGSFGWYADFPVKEH